MGKAGETTFPNLKAATGIADNRLLYHSPNPPNADTAFSDFLIGGIGRRVVDEPEFTQSNLSGNGDFDLHIGCPSSTVGGNNGWPFDATGGSIDGSGNFIPNNDTQIEPGDKIWVRINTDIEATGEYGEYWAEQVGKNGGSLVVTTTSGFTTTGNREVGVDDAGYYAVDIELKKTDSESSEVRFELQDGLNTDATNYGPVSGQTPGTPSVSFTGLRFTTPNTRIPFTHIQGLTVAWSNEGGQGSELGCDVDIQNPLDADGTRGDASYSIRATASIDNGGDRGPLYTWFYEASDPDNLGCPGDGTHLRKVSPAGSCQEFEFAMGTGRHFVRAVLTEGSGTGTVIDTKEIELTPNTTEPDSSSVSASYSEPTPGLC